MTLVEKQIERKKLEDRLKKLEAKNVILQKKIELGMTQNKCYFWKPWPHQQRIIDLIREEKKILLLQGANRVGKSILGVNIVAAICLGLEPWTREKPTWVPTPPCKVRIVGVEWEHQIREVIIPALREWLPQGEYETRKNNVGVDAYFQFKNGSTIELLTHSQDTKAHEGWRGNMVWADEPIPHDKYVANLRGLIDTSGIFLMTMTAMYENYILDEIVNSGNSSVGCVLEIPMRANPLLKQEDIDTFSKGLTDEEREVRVAGGWLQRQGLVIKNFNNMKDKIIVNDFKIPPDYPVIVCIDLHLNKPQAVSFFAWDQYDRIYVFDEILENISPSELADEIIRRKSSQNLRLKRAFIDPISKGDSAYVKNRFGNVEDSFQIIEKKLRPHGISLESASKDKESGVRNIQSRISGVNGAPSLYFCEKAKRTIWEIQRLKFDAEGRPEKVNDDMFENLYRATLSGTKYVDPKRYTKELKYKYKSQGIV